MSPPSFPPVQGPLPLLADAKAKALRPILHKASTVTVQPAQLPAPAARPPMHELFAHAFALLPSIHTYYGLLTQKAKFLYDYLFNPAVLTVPEPDEPPTSLTPDEPMPDATTSSLEISPTPFAQLVSEFVNLEASFDDSWRRLSAPKIQPSDHTMDPITPPVALHTDDFSYLSLLNFLHSQLSPYFSSLIDATNPPGLFLTLIVGPPDHPNAPYCLHSHLVGCHTSSLEDSRNIILFFLSRLVLRVSGIIVL